MRVGGFACLFLLLWSLFLASPDVRPSAVEGRG